MGWFMYVRGWFESLSGEAIKHFAVGLVAVTIGLTASGVAQTRTAAAAERADAERAMAEKATREAAPEVRRQGKASAADELCVAASAADLTPAAATRVISAHRTKAEAAGVSWASISDAATAECPSDFAALNRLTAEYEDLKRKTRANSDRSATAAPKKTAPGSQQSSPRSSSSTSRATSSGGAAVFVAYMRDLEGPGLRDVPDSTIVALGRSVCETLGMGFTPADTIGAMAIMAADDPTITPSMIGRFVAGAQNFLC